MESQTHNSLDVDFAGPCLKIIIKINLFSPQNATIFLDFQKLPSHLSKLSTRKIFFWLKFSNEKDRKKISKYKKKTEKKIRPVIDSTDRRSVGGDPLLLLVARLLSGSRLFDVLLSRPTEHAPHHKPRMERVIIRMARNRIRTALHFLPFANHSQFPQVSHAHSPFSAISSPIFCNSAAQSLIPHCSCSNRHSAVCQ